MHLHHKHSPHDVATTVDRLEHAVKQAGATVFARVDHGGGAQAAGLELRPTELLVFGNPTVGTPLMQQNQVIGLDLPLRVVTYQDENGQVRMSYHDLVELAANFGLSAGPVVDRVAAVLEDLTDRAVAPT